MTQTTKRWLTKNADGEVQGPYSTEEVLKRISAGKLTGNEKICLFPGYHWIPISREPKFYDCLLSLLDMSAGTSESSQSLNLSKKDIPEEPESVKGKEGGSRAIKSDKEDLFNSGRHKIKKQGETLSSEEGETQDQDILEDEEDDSVIELVSFDESVKAERRTLIIRAFLVGGILLIIGAIIFSMEDEFEEGIHLVAPNFKIKSNDKKKSKKYQKQGLSHFYKDHIFEYLKAQKMFVKAIEAAPSQTRNYSWLCMAYLEIWPYTFQTSEDLKIVDNVRKKASLSDPTGRDGVTCKTVNYIVRGKTQEAKRMIELALDSYGGEGENPILFYYLKAVLLDQINEHQVALGYLNTVEQSLPRWIRPYSLEAEIRVQLNQQTQAVSRYEEILRVNPNHQVAKAQMGLIEHHYFRHTEKAKKWFQDVIQVENEVPGRLIAEVFMGLAEISLREGNRARALGFAQKSYAINPGDLAVKNLIVKIGGEEKVKSTKLNGQQLIFEGDQLVREGHCDRALEFYQKAFQITEKNGIPALKAAKCYMKQALRSDAIKWLKMAIKADMHLVEAYIELADVYSKRYNFLAAIRILNSGRRLFPKNYEIYKGFAMVELRRGNPSGVIAYCERALKFYDIDVDTLVVLSKGQMLAGEYGSAFKSATRAIELDENSAEAQVAYSQALAGVRGIGIGSDYLIGLVNRYPLVLRYRLALGDLYLGDQQFQQAKKIFLEVISINDKSLEGFLGLGKANRYLDLLGDSKDAFLSAALVDPSDSEPFFQMGLLYLNANKPSDAKVQFDRVIRVNTRYPLVHYFLGLAALQLGDTKEALRQAELEKRRGPKASEAYTLAAEAYLKLKQYSLCAREYQKAINYRAQDARVFVKVARCYRLSGNFDVAKAMLAEAARQESGLAEIYKEQGAIFEMRGEIEHAINSYNRYFELDPQATDRAQIERRIILLQQKPSR